MILTDIEDIVLSDSLYALKINKLLHFSHKIFDYASLSTMFKSVTIKHKKN